MGFLLQAYLNDSTAPVTNQDMTALTDQVISRRNNHYFYTAPFKMLQASLYGTTVTRGSIQSPTLNAYTLFNIWGINDSSVSLSPPRADLYWDYPVAIPQNEEIQLSITSTAGDNTTAVLIYGTPDWTRTIPRGVGPVPVFQLRFTCSITGNSQQYSTPAALTLEQSLRAGTYAVVGCQMQGTGLIAFRMIFNRPPYSNGIPLRPGALANQTIGDQPVVNAPFGALSWGEWGRFATTEYPQIEAIMVGTSTITAEGRMQVVYLGDNINVTY